MKNGSRAPVPLRRLNKAGATYKDLVMEAWDRMYGPEERAERRKKLWVKEEMHRKAKERL